METGKRRKVRSDKKVDVKPTLLIELKECLYRLSYITNTPVKNIAAHICEKGLSSTTVLDYLSKSFRRSVHIGSTLYMGDLERPSLQKKMSAGETGKITIKFSQATYDTICVLAFGLGVTPTRATALLINAAIYYSDFADTYVRKHVEEQLDTSRKKELRKVLQFINASSDYEQKVSWASFLSVIYDDFLTGNNTISDSIQEFLDRWKK